MGRILIVVKLYIKIPPDRFLLTYSNMYMYMNSVHLELDNDLNHTSFLSFTSYVSMLKRTIGNGV